MVRNVTVLFFLFFGSAIFAQDFGYGFKAGLNFNSFVGDSESDANGNELEDFTSNTGFHVGAIFTWKATELMGLRGELTYIQKGGRRTYEGPSYLNLFSSSGSVIETTGTRKQNLNITSSYFEIPISGYVKPFEWLELYAGGSVAFMVAANTFGELIYSDGMVGTSAIEPNPFRYEIDGNYFSDNPRERFYSNPPETVTFGSGALAEVPNIAGVYGEFDTDRGNLYKVIEFNALAGVSVYLNRGLFISGRLNYSLSDITKQNADVSLLSKNNGEFITRDDDDRNFSIMTSIGFSF